MTSNIELSAVIIDAITKVWGFDNSTQAKRIKLLDEVKAVLNWTQVVSPTPNNVGKGLSTASKESWEQLKVLSYKTLTPADKKLFNLDKKGAVAADIDTAEGSDWQKAQGKVNSKLKDLKNDLMKIQDRALYDATGGNLGKIDKVEVGGKAEVKEEVEQDILVKAEQGAKNYLAFIEKNKDALGETYATKRNAVITMMEASGYKR